VPIFNREEFIKKWVEENPEIEIPKEPSDDKDTDWILTEEEEQQLLAGVMAKEQP